MGAVVRPFKDVWIGLLDAEGNEPTAKSYRRVPCRLLLGPGMYLNATAVEIGPIGEDWGRIEATASFRSAASRDARRSLLVKMKLPNAASIQAHDILQYDPGQITISITLGRRPLSPGDLN